jgi:hypothetical protein
MVFVSWPDVIGETHYRLQRARQIDGVWTRWGTVATLAMNSTGVSDASLIAESAYRYRVQACNAIGCSAYRVVYVTTPVPGPPPAPTGLSATALSPTQVSLVWSDVQGESHYQVQRRTRTGSTWGVWTWSGWPPVNTTSHVDAGLQAETTYRHRVRSCNSDGCSAWAAFPIVTTPGL